GLMTSHVARVAECQSLAADGVTPREAAERLKKNRFYVEKLFEQAANFTADELRDAIVRLAELDLALKGGSRLAGELEFSRALVDLGTSSLQASRQRLDRRAVAQVLEPLASCGPDALLLLFDVGHDVKTPASRAARS